MRLVKAVLLVLIVGAMATVGAGVVLARSFHHDGFRPPAVLTRVTARVERLWSHSKGVVKREWSSVERPLAAKSDPPKHAAPKTETMKSTESIASVRPACLVPDEDQKTIEIRIYRGMTLADLATHFHTTPRAIRQLNPTLNGSRLVAGETYRVGVSHLQIVRHRISHGETMWDLARRFDAPTAYSIRTWNCLDSSTLTAGDDLILFEPVDHVRRAAARRSAS